MAHERWNVKEIFDNREPEYGYPVTIKVECETIFYRDDDSVRGQCKFEGEVEAEAYKGYLYWTCPECETDHEQQDDWFDEPEAS